MIKEFDSFRTDDEGTFYYYKDKNGVENQWSYNLDELEYYIKSNEKEIKRLTKRLEEAQLGYLAIDKRVNKAIKYMNISQEILDTCNIYDVNGIEVYKILKGSDKE